MPLPTNAIDLQLAGYKFSDKGQCSKCRASIEWWITPKNRKTPLDSGTLITHFATCPNAAEFRKKK